METRICKKCSKEKSLIEFRLCKKKNKNNGNIYPHYRGECKECGNLLCLKWRKENPEKSKLSYTNYKEKNKDKLSLYQKEWIDKNPEYFQKYSKSEERKKSTKKYRDRMRENNLFKLSQAIRSLIYNSIRRLGYTKKSRTFIILGCSYIEFKIHLEKQFVEGMSWENYGEWHIDHKIPISWAKTEEEVYKFNNYINLQPLWSVENMSKSNRYESK